jgi:hypothetical protein
MAVEAGLHANDLEIGEFFADAEHMDLLVNGVRGKPR